MNPCSVWDIHSLSLYLFANATPSLAVWYTADSMQSSAHLFMYINNKLHTERTDGGKKNNTKQQGKSNHNLLSLFFIMWLAWITVPLAPISFPRLRHTGSIPQLTKWPLNHVILLSVYHWQKEANLIAHFSRSPKAKYNGILMKCIKCPYILFPHIKQRRFLHRGSVCSMFITMDKTQKRKAFQSCNQMIHFLHYSVAHRFLHIECLLNNGNRCALMAVVAFLCTAS